MATVILNHRVKDYNSWKAGYDGDKQRRDAAGLTEIAVGKKSDDPGMAYMIWQMEDTSLIQKMLGDADLQKTMQEAGVISTPEMVIVE